MLRSTTAATAGPLRPVLAPQLSLGAVVLGGHADLWAATRLGGLPLGAADGVAGGLRPGTEAGLRAYPLALRDTGLFPSLGLSWRAGQLAQATPDQGSGPRLPTHQLHGRLGLHWRRGLHGLDLGLGWAPGPALRMPVSRTQDGQIETDALTLGLDYRVALGPALARPPRPRRDAPATAELALGAVAAHSLAPTWRGAPAGDPRAFLGERPAGAAAPSVAAGLVLARPALVLRADWRPIHQQSIAYGATRSWRRQSVAIDAIKILGNDHVAGILGAGASIEALAFAETDTAATATAPVAETTGLRLAPTLLGGMELGVAGWHSWRLRTTLRTTPGLHLAPPGGTGRLDLQQLELGAQLVWRPQRPPAGA